MLSENNKKIIEINKLLKTAGYQTVLITKENDMVLFFYLDEQPVVLGIQNDSLNRNNFCIGSLSYWQETVQFGIFMTTSKINVDIIEESFNDALELFEIELLTNNFITDKKDSIKTFISQNKYTLYG